MSPIPFWLCKKVLFLIVIFTIIKTALLVQGHFWEGSDEREDWMDRDWVSGFDLKGFLDERSQMWIEGISSG